MVPITVSAVDAAVERCQASETCLGAVMLANHCLAHLAPDELDEVADRLRAGEPLDARATAITSECLQALTRAVRGTDDHLVLPTVDFRGAIFSGDADFRFATFKGSVHFGGARFSGTADFYGATFSGDVDFQATTFTSDAGFGRATFSKQATFRSASFSSHASFAERRRSLAATLSDDEEPVLRAADFREVTFADLWTFGRRHSAPCPTILRPTFSERHLRDDAGSG